MPCKRPGAGRVFRTFALNKGGMRRCPWAGLFLVMQPDLDDIFHGGNNQGVLRLGKGGVWSGRAGK
jgi:hypothetical protein